MFDNDISLTDGENIIESGFDCSRSKCEKNKLEKCIRKSKRIIKVVVVDAGEHLVIIHIGSFTALKKEITSI